MQGAVTIVNRQNGSLNLARIERGSTPVLFGATERARRKFRELFTIRYGYCT